MDIKIPLLNTNNNSDVLLNFKGNISHDVITTILKKLKTVSIENDCAVNKKIYSIVNELLENINYHTNELRRYLEILITKENQQIKIATFNYSTKSKINKLIEKINHINDLSLEEVKNQYSQKLKNNTLSEKGTIGVGLETIRLKSKNKILINNLSNQKNSFNEVVIEVMICL